MKQPETYQTDKKPPVFSMDYPDMLKWKMIQEMQKTLNDDSNEGIYQHFYNLKMLCQATKNPSEILSHFNEQEIQQLRLLDILFNTLQAKNTLEKSDANFAKQLAGELSLMSDLLIQGYAAFIINQDFDSTPHTWTAIEVEQFCNKQTQSILNIYQRHLEEPEAQLFKILQANIPHNFFEWLLSKIQELKENLFGKSKEQYAADEKNLQLFSNLKTVKETFYAFQHTFFKPTLTDEGEKLDPQKKTEINYGSIPTCN